MGRRTQAKLELWRGQKSSHGRGIKHSDHSESQQENGEWEKNPGRNTLRDRTDTGRRQQLQVEHGRREEEP